jgi:ankyrin repeat protein
LPFALQVLLEANAAVDKPIIANGGSPLAVATWMGHTHVMRVLLAAGADPHCVSTANESDTPVTIAKRSRDAEVKKVLGLKVGNVRPVRSQALPLLMRVSNLGDIDLRTCSVQGTLDSLSLYM